MNKLVSLLMSVLLATSLAPFGSSSHADGSASLDDAVMSGAEGVASERVAVVSGAATVELGAGDVVVIAASGDVGANAFASVDDLRAATHLAEGDVATTSAYYENGPSDGGATYDIVAAPPAAGETLSGREGAVFDPASRLAASAADTAAFVDDGGSHIKLDNGFWAVMRVADDTVNVHQFGAKGDGMTDGTAQTANANAAKAADDAERLAAAMDYATAHPGTTVYFPEGTYCVSRGIEVPAHTTLTGAYRTTASEPAPAIAAEGKSATLGMYAGGIMRAKAEGQEDNTELLATITPLDPTSHATSLISLGASEDVTVDHLVIDAGRSIQAVVDALPDYSINNYDWTDPAMPYRGYFTALTFGGNENVSVADCIIRNNVSMGCQYNGGENVRFERCDFLSVDVGIQEQGDNPVKDVFVRDCCFEGHDWSEPVAFGPSYVGDATGIWIERNTMRGIKRAHAIVLGERTQAYVDHTTFKDVHINGNTAHDMATFIGISVADGVKMRDNKSYDAGQSYLYSCKNVEIDGLEMHGSARHGLLVGQECENVSIEGLVVEGYDKDGNKAPGIDLSGTAVNVSLAGRVENALGDRGPGLNLSGSGYDISGLQFDLEPANYFDVMVHEGGVGNTLHAGPGTARKLGIDEGAYRIPRMYVAEAVARANDFVFDCAWPERDRGTATTVGAREQFSGMRTTDAGAFETLTTLPTGHGRYYRTLAIQAWDGAEDGTENLAASYTEPAQDGFTRTLSVLTASDMRLTNGNPSRAGAIVWAGERTLAASGEPYEIELVCQDGVWYEQGAGAIEFPSLSALRNATDLAVGQVAQTLAYREGSGTGGANYLVCDAAAAADLIGCQVSGLADDGGRLIELAGASGLWAVLVGVEADAYEFGAYGDGVHDDADVLQALLDSGLESVRLSEGTYLVDTPLVARAPLSIEGAGMGASKLVASGALSSPGGEALLTVRGVEGFAISDAGFAGPGRDAVAGALDLLRIDGCVQTKVVRCAFGPAAGDGVVITDATRTEVSDCAIEDVATGIRVSGAAAGADDVVTLKGNGISNTAVDGIAFAADGSTYQGKIAVFGNTISGAPAGAGILLAHANRYELVEIGSNAIEECYVGIRAGGIAGTLDDTDNNPRRMSMNIVRDATYGIILERSSGVALIQNEVFDVERTGFYLDTLAECCTIWGWVTRYGLDTADASDGLSDGCAIECVGEAENVTLGGWVRGNRDLAEYSATRGRTALRIDGSGWDASGLTFYCSMNESYGQSMVTFAQGASNNVFRTQDAAIVLDASGNGTNAIGKMTDDVVLVVKEGDEVARIQKVDNPTDPRTGLPDDGRVYASVDALKADSSLAAGDVAMTRAYHAGGAGGSVSAGKGVYDVKAASDVAFENSSAAADDGRYIALDNGLVAVLHTSADTVDLYQYGARGDGATDDSARVQAAFSSGLATVRVSAGTYVCGGAVIPSNTSVVGAGRDTCAFVSPLGEGGYGTAGPLGIASGARDVVLKGVTVDGRRDVYAKTGVSKGADAPELSGDAAHFVYDAEGAGNYTLLGWLGGAEGISVEGCRFKSNNSEAVKFVGGKDISFTGCEFFDVDCGIITQGGGEEGNVAGLTVDGCTFDGHWFSEPISMFAEGSSYEELVFTNNVFKNKPAGSAILLYSDDGERANTFRDVTISGNSAQRCSGGLSLYAVDGATIADNDLGGSTARLHGCSNMTLVGLAFKDCLQSALVLRDCVDVKVSGLDVDGFGVASQVFPAISVGDASGGQNAGCSIAGTVRGAASPDGSWRSAVIATAGGVDLSGVTFDVGANVHALFVNAGVTGLAYRTAQDVSIYDGSETLGNDIVVEHEVTLSGGASLDNWNRTHNTIYTLNWTTYARESLTYMQPCQDGFTRTLAVRAVNSDAMLADGDGSQGSIIWLGGGHTVEKGESATFKLICQDGVWHEAGRKSTDIADVDDVLLNPGKGWVAYGAGADKMTDWEHYAEDGAQASDYSDKTGIGYWRWDWAEIEPERGRYNWKPIDDAIAGFWAQGKQFAFGVMAANTASSREYVTPKWVFDAGAACESFADKGADGKTTQVFPVWTDETFLACADEFVAALGARYDGDPRVAFVDIRSYGNYGEQHLYGINDTPGDGWKWMLERNITSEFLRERYITPYMTAFPNTLLVNVWGLEQYDDTYRWAIENGVSIRRDGIMYHSDGHECAMAAGKLPTMYEYSWNYWRWKNQLYVDKWETEDEWHAWFQEEFTRELEIGKPSYLQLDFNMYRENPQFCDLLANRMGYWLRLKHAEYDNAITSGEATEVSLTFANDGVAAIFRPAVSCLALLDANGEVVARRALGWKAADWKPGAQKVETASVAFDGVDAGSYRLAFGLFASESDEAPTYLLGSAGATADKWYPFGTVQVEAAEDDPEPPAHAHALERVAAVSATCLTPGAREHWRCTGCGKLFSDAAGTQEIDAESLVIAAMGHDWGEWRITADATTTTEGAEARVCKNNPTHVETRSIPKVEEEATPPDEGDTGEGEPKPGEEDPKPGEDDPKPGKGDSKPAVDDPKPGDTGDSTEGGSSSNTDNPDGSNDGGKPEAGGNNPPADGGNTGESPKPDVSGNDPAPDNTPTATDSDAGTDAGSDAGAGTGAAAGAGTGAGTDAAAGVSADAGTGKGAAASASPSVAVRPIYRMANPKNGERLYLANFKKVASLVRGKWRYEGIAFYTPVKSGVPVYRLVNKKTGRSLYTTSKSKRGWKSKGRAFFAMKSKGVKVYRMRHKQTGASILTKRPAEVKRLKKLGYRKREVAFRAFA